VDRIELRLGGHPLGLLDESTGLGRSLRHHLSTHAIDRLARHQGETEQDRSGDLEEAAVHTASGLRVRLSSGVTSRTGLARERILSVR
jgi:hypothetical protein